MLGLKRHTVRLEEYQPEWHQIFLQTKKELLKEIGDLVMDIQHVGSTAIPGIPAKPILDIAIAIDAKDHLKDIIVKLEDLGYEYRGDSREDGGQLFVMNIGPGVRSKHVHIVLQDDPQWQNYLRFRDTLIARPDLSREYTALKASLATQFPQDRKSYTSGKHQFIRSVLEGMP